MKVVRESLNEAVLNEVGELSAKPYKWKQITKAGMYEFYTEDNDKYVVYFYSPDDDDIYTLDFYVSKPLNRPKDYNPYRYVVNKGRIFKVLSTVLDIVKEKIRKDKRNKINKIIIKPGRDFETDDRRFNIYKRVIERNLPDNWEMKDRLLTLTKSKFIQIIRKNL